MRLVDLLLLLVTSLLAGSAKPKDLPWSGPDPNRENDRNHTHWRKHALVIGINEHDDEKLTDLRGARRDAENGQSRVG